MDENRFWNIIASSRRRFIAQRDESDANGKRQVQDLRAELDALSAADVAAFDARFHHLMAAAYRWDLWGAAYLLAGGCSDDGFTDFRYWLISMGRDVYAAALNAADSLARTVFSPGVHYPSFEAFGHVASQVYKAKTGRPFPASPSLQPSKPLGERFDDDEDALKRLYPAIAAALPEDF